MKFLHSHSNQITVIRLLAHSNQITTVQLVAVKWNEEEEKEEDAASCDAHGDFHEIDS